MKRRSAWIAAVSVSAAAAGLLVWSTWNSAEPPLTQAEAESKLLKLYAGEIESANQTGDLYEMQLRTEAGLYKVNLYTADGRVESIRRLEKAAVTPQEIVSRDEIKNRLEGQAGIRVDRLELANSEDGEERLYVAELTEASGERRKLEIDAYTGSTLTDIRLPGNTSGAAGSGEGQNGGTAGGEKPGGSGSPPDQGAGKPGESGESVPSSGGAVDSPGKPADGVNARLLSEQQARAAAAAALGVNANAVKDSDAELRGEGNGQAYYLVDVELKSGRKAEVQINALSGAMQTITWDEDDNNNNDDDSDENDDDDDDNDDD